MLPTLRGTRALVTGASSGIGAATARALAARGCRLHLVGRDPDRLEAVAGEVGATCTTADLTGAEGLREVEPLCDEAEVLVLNAGRGWAGETAAMPPAEIDALAALNLVAPLRLARAALPGMLRRGRGQLVFVSSIAAVGVAEEDVYAATKAGVRTFAASLRQTARPRGVGVTAVLPGAVRTPFFDARGRAYARSVPRMVDPHRVADALVRGVRRDAAEVFVPRWLGLAARVQGALPGTFGRLARGARS
ncbi:SDR family NAD(P)-dependent oxidoreductase [Salinifilum aidingensis]